MITQEEYNAKRDARYQKLLAAAEKAEAEGRAIREQASKMADIIPMGQPILVGHYSEGRDRNYRNRIDSKFRKGYELAKQAEEYRSRAASVASNDAIYSDDPTATEQLAAKLATLEAEQNEMKRINKELRSGKPFDQVGMSEAHRADLLSCARHQAYYQPLTKGFPPYALTNNNAKIKATKDRLALVQKKQATPDKDETIGDVKIEWRASENRIRVIFPARVDAETFKDLRQYGYRAMKEAGTFSAFYNYRAGELINKLRHPKQ